MDLTQLIDCLPGRCAAVQVWPRWSKMWEFGWCIIPELFLPFPTHGCGGSKGKCGLLTRVLSLHFSSSIPMRGGGWFSGLPNTPTHSWIHNWNIPEEHQQQQKVCRQWALCVLWPPNGTARWLLRFLQVLPMRMCVWEISCYSLGDIFFLLVAAS